MPELTALDVFAPPPEASPEELGELLVPRFSDDDLALRFTQQHADDLRYVDGWGRWLHWNGSQWSEDDTLAVFDRARMICREAALECDPKEKTLATRLTSAGTVSAVERLARADRRHAATVDQWDSDPWLLNTPTGIVNLRAGETFSHDRAQYLTKITAAGPGGGCPLWLQFLERVTNRDRDLQAFLQRLVGYCLTGSTREHALLFFYGLGSNGKSVFLSTVAGLLGDYAKTAPSATFTAGSTDQHPTDLAGLRGARLVTAIETEDGRWWSEAKIKSLTGGDKIAARYMRQDFFEFRPQFKLCIAGNHRPGLRNVDEAIRRRMNLVSFTVTIPPAERDLELAEKLKAEYPGIMRWAVEGCLAWQQEGLNPPEAVRSATEAYLESEDAIARWIEDRCVTGGRYWTAGAALYCDHKEWCEQSGERAKSKKALTQALEARGFPQERTNKSRGFAGIGLKGDLA